MTTAGAFGISISAVLRDLGYAGLALLMVVENLFPPIPSEAVLPLAGYLIESGEFQPLPVFVAATAGSVGGAVILYELARHGGRPFVTRFLRFARVRPDQLERAEEWFARRGPWVVLLGRCVPGVRSVVSLPAGVLHMPRAQYLALTLAGSAAWNALLIGAGWALGSQWERVSDVVGSLSTPLLVALVLLAAGVLLWRGLRGRRRPKA